MAEALLRSRLDGVGQAVRVHSAGLLEDGRPVTDDGRRVMADRGLDTSDHRSRRMTPELLTGSDLVLGMTREHVREAVLLAPTIWPRTFTLKELVRRARVVGPRPAGAALEDWLAVVGEGRERADLLGDSPDDDVADPVGRGVAAYRRTADELDALIAELAGLLWPASRRAHRPPAPIQPFE